MHQSFIEIVNRREVIITNTNPVTVEQKVIEMGMRDAFDFMVEMCINVYQLNIDTILG